MGARTFCEKNCHFAPSFCTVCKYTVCASGRPSRPRASPPPPKLLFAPSLAHRTTPPTHAPTNAGKSHKCDCASVGSEGAAEGDEDAEAEEEEEEEAGGEDEEEEDDDGEEGEDEDGEEGGGYFTKSQMSQMMSTFTAQMKRGGKAGGGGK